MVILEQFQSNLAKILAMLLFICYNKPRKWEQIGAGVPLSLQNCC